MRPSVFALILLSFASPVWATDFRVCTDPNNMPFSNQKCDVQIARSFMKDLPTK